mmetsp:Transcript_28907/g.63663  ORF Transcript_28907/g.63663 Transcript_28907/m.63663 type:complete len:196 (+) Transcript_28907:58-645(+)|eukprot:CAMPEP_0204270596 /NCGR_PEP_ID=MMETSP0468-20130131/18986_1 /ASSEMBLY_ACC=CAM_ASM_000383 /TAXON_ID=2969 /ORGANISM="Oxyrrhis marina" /LENGTH=195 /DNA_ID=CAMNT_0051246149 /DNA_START=58 /DNA_END=645 /DNA_ORIENTATION=-
MTTLQNTRALAEDEKISQVELTSLTLVFQFIDTNKDGKLDAKEISEVLAKLGHKTSRPDIEMMIWEVDNDLDGLVSKDEFLVMYQRCISDKTGLEPRNLFHLAQFLMYAFKGSVDTSGDKAPDTRISVEQTLQILFVRYGRESMNEEITHIFGDESQQKGPDGQERRITYSEFVRHQTQRLTKLRNAKREVSKSK